MSEPSVFRPGGVSYLRIPAPDGASLGAFYAAAFDWTVDDARFADATGHVIGHFLSDHEVAGEAGIRPYIYVADVDRTRAQIVAAGGQIVTEPYAEGDLWVGCFRDPAGNVLGFWQAGPRADQ